MKPIPIFLLFTYVSAFANSHRELPRETDPQSDSRNESCAQLAIAAKSGGRINYDDAAIAHCEKGNRTVCLRTQQILKENPHSKELLKSCSGPVEMAATFTESALAICRLSMFVVSCLVNGPPTPTLEDIPRPGIQRIGPPIRPGVSSK